MTVERDGGSDRKVAGPLSAVLRRGAVISAVVLVAMQLISLASTLVLARLLSPAEIGVYAAGTVLSGFLVMFAHSGLQSALVQREGNVEDAADTVFWATAATGVLMSMMALAAAPLVGMAFHSEQAAHIAAITSGMLLMHALTNVPDGLMQRRFNFKKRLIIDPARAFAYAAVAVVLAAAGAGVYALVIGNYVSLAVWLIGSWLVARWRPGVGRPTVRLWRELARFATPVVVQGIVEQVRDAAEALLVGRRLGEASLGQYRYGKRLLLIPTLAVVEVGSYVLFPAFSRLADEPERLKRAFLRALRWVWFVSAPVTALMVAVGESAVVVLLGDPWREAGVFVVAAASYGAGAALAAVANEVIKARGRPRLLHWTSVTQLVLGVGLVAALLPLGVFGVGLAISATQITSGVLVLGLARMVVAFSARELLRIIVPPVVASVLACAAVWPLERFVVRADQSSLVAGVGLLVLDVIMFVGVYLAILRVLDKQIVVDLAQSMRSAGNRALRRVRS
jgi:O-antigen/teichoic acid export membrane protein